ncbi:putative malto-oligosyltrehalose trehalohydrolase, galactose oxidase, beta-propeller [Lupinus albus]|uniref:Putative malto-oligosyltrehalose trehalohydrolase, galactose oxidase, beta-propeller n=1 Tax=Lupinus albus TaxID=3870 RepID=A0A6A4N2C4_LUPAL|nr:putative malto-oligosyltrehalose trehalohydrolase, galactose oxidase, beta-propeller [Lupinus albus]
MNAVLNPFFYKPKNENGSWFEVMNPSTISRMYHSSTVLLRDGRVIVGISNPHKFYEFTPSFYPTKLTLEAFSPPYLDPMFAPLRLKILEPTSQTNLKYVEYFKMSFQVNETLMIESVCVTMLAPPLNTHSFSMNQRLLVLATTKVNTI